MQRVYKIQNQKSLSTRWLYLEHCVNRELKTYAGQKSYFLSEGLHNKGFKLLKELVNVNDRVASAFFSIKHHHFH